ncbi:MAG: hypothetical protein FWD63_01920 [Propionibacteriaceae bacterium]|nr:hypothetical protein [Propionibacteriaceae bacterium]
MSADSAMTDVTIDDFTAGLLGGLGKLGVRTLYMEGAKFYDAAIRAFRDFAARCQGEGLSPDFRIQKRAFYDDSPDFRDALTRASQSGLVSFDNPGFVDIRLKFTGEDAGLILDTVDGSADLYIGVARSFRDAASL